MSKCCKSSSSSFSTHSNACRWLQCKGLGHQWFLVQACQTTLRTLSAKLHTLYSLGASLFAWVVSPFTGGPYWCYFPSGFAEWAVSIYAISTVWCIMVRNTLAKRFAELAVFIYAISTVWCIMVHNSLAKGLAFPAGEDPCTDCHVGCHVLSVLMHWCVHG